jgi:hypothetical protein
LSVLVVKRLQAESLVGAAFADLLTLEPVLLLRPDSAMGLDLGALKLL